MYFTSVWDQSNRQGYELWKYKVSQYKVVREMETGFIQGHYECDESDF